MKNNIIPSVLILATLLCNAEWPQFYGPNRDNLSLDEDLLETWPEGGPPLLWEVDGIGEGYSTVAVIGGRIYTTGEIDSECMITALDMEGRKLWSSRNGEAWKKSYPGTRSTPTIKGGLLYHLSGNGNVICLKTESGELVWQVNILEKFAGRNIKWGLSESLLVEDGMVFCVTGGEEVSMVALDSKTGKLIWKCTGAGDKPGYASPILIDYQGLKQVVTAMSESIIGVRASDGRLLWRFPHKVYADENITTPLFKEGLLIISGCGKKGTRALKLDVSGKECEARQKWHNPALDNKQGGLVLFNERIYGYAESQRKAGPWMCIDFKSGRTLFQESPVRSTYIFKCGSITCADGLLYLFSDNGNMALVKPLETGFETKGHLTVKEKGSRPTWAFPVVYGGRLYIRCGDNLFAYNVLK